MAWVVKSRTTLLNTPRYGCIEAGGTKFVLGIATGPDDVQATARVETTTPDETLEAVKRWFAGQPPTAALGIASFGPVEVRGDASRWGYITETTKPGWSNTDFAGALGQALSVPVGFDTDVNGAALGEHRWGALKDCETGVYVTIGTGIGGGAVIGGVPLHGSPHPEMGHVLPQRYRGDDFPGICPFHGACYEGLASGPAIKARYGVSLSQLPPDHPGHAMTGWYLGQLAVAIQAMLAPRRIVMGGGVTATPGLLDRARAAATDLGGGYFKPEIVAPGLGDRAGLLGALVLAMEAQERRSVSQPTPLP